MPSTPLPVGEGEGLVALRSCNLLDTGADEALAQIVTPASNLTGNPIALLSLVDGAAAVQGQPGPADAGDAARDGVLRGRSPGDRGHRRLPSATVTEAPAIPAWRLPVDHPPQPSPSSVSGA